MCTALTFRGNHHYFGRNLDLKYSYEEQVTLTPRNFTIQFRCAPPLMTHHAILGMAYVQEGYPLYYDAMNEAGLAMAGLNFPGYAVYHPRRAGADNITPFELIPWVLGQCANIEQARALLRRVSLLEENFSPELPLTPMHWIAADREKAIVIEPLEEGLRVYDAPVEVLTNTPPFHWQMTNLSWFRSLSSLPPENRLAPELKLPLLSRGMGAVGLPGDLSSPSRFVRAAFTRWNPPQNLPLEEELPHFFHLLGSVAQVRGTVRLPEGGEVRTIYSSCCDLDEGLYCYNTYENSRVSAVNLHRENLEGDRLVSYPLRRKADIFLQN